MRVTITLQKGIAQNVLFQICFEISIQKLQEWEKQQEQEVGEKIKN